MLSTLPAFGRWPQMCDSGLSMTSFRERLIGSLRGPCAARSRHPMCVWAFVMGLVGGCSYPLSTIQDCTASIGAMDREECYFQIAQGLGGERDALAAAVAQIPSRDSRDLLRLRLAVQDPIAWGWLCKEAEGEDARLRCVNVIRRPHLLKPPPPAR